ncbi:hypothetical protein FRD01_13765 [Microvenator marinus]|uniref:EGF-like domain-containing protein n=1 Tax=Microvenator marinus TaxID=2600177 RepID=A0A5B8XX50_9DELT|nr:nidogen-like domain-containing protein [Microvenator marinus]QED28276.1 hypothetical protein FRD01_13765 [Microvenator marinus]
MKFKSIVIGLIALGAGDALAADLVQCPSGGFGVPQRVTLIALDPLGALDDGGSLDDGGVAVDVSSVFPAGINISGNSYTTVYMNVNGNISFGSQYSTFTPVAIPGLDRPIIAPYFSDVDIRPINGGELYVCNDSANGRFIFTWDNVGYYDQKTDRTNSYQAILTFADPECGGIPTADIEFRYENLEWTTGDASDGTGGLGGSEAVAGIDAGDTINAVALPGSGTAAVLDLVNDTNANTLGVFRYRLAQGTLPSCGNGTLELCETCDEGVNNDNNGSCTLICQLNECGDGFAHFGVEVCDGDEISPGSDQCPTGYEGFPVCNNSAVSPDFNDTCTLSSPPAGCDDIDECTEGTDNCDALTTCVNNDGGFTCTSCPAGYSDVNGDGTECVDIDECADTANPVCDTLTTCSNTTGGFTCTACPDGYNDVNGDGTECVDIDECADTANPVCDALTTCSNTTGGFTCSACPDGYDDVNGDGTECVDIDECADTANPVCDALTTCTNTTGGFTCTACPAGYTDVNGDGTVCVDIDECADTANPVCDEVTTCTNTTGGFTCSACPDGYTDVNGDGTVCEDIDECADTANPVCDELSVCNNTEGGFVCGACPDGYNDINGDGSLCEDIDECADTENPVCDELTVCSNTDGGFECTACPDGYTDVNGDGTVCEDVDECADTENPVCDELTACSNTDGGFTCTACPDGYTDVNGDGTVCEDIDECADTENPVCDENVACNNTEGGFLCGACPDGYTDVNGDGTVCEDIDECVETETPVCGEGSECTNTEGGFECSECPDGYTDVNGDGTVCEDIDECEMVDICGEGGECVNTAGNYTCECDEGFVLDGAECVIDEDLVEDNTTQFVSGSGCSAAGNSSPGSALMLLLLGLVSVRVRRRVK